MSEFPETFDTANLVERLAQSDEDAASLLFERYVVRLTALARSRMSQRLSKRLDPEDVVMSAFRSFFVGARNRQYAFTSRDDFWPLLVTITLHKIHRQVSQQQAVRRDIRREQPTESSDWMTSILSRDPSPDEVAAVSDLLQEFMGHLDEQSRLVLELRLQGESTQAIAVAIGKTERTVRRIMEQIREIFTRRYGEVGATFDPSMLHGIPDSSTPTPRSGRFPKATRNVADFETAFRYDDFILEQMIGSGGMGKVYRSRQRSTGKTFALKFLRKMHLTSHQSVLSFVREAEFVQRLNHPGIVGVRGLGRTPWGGLFIVMENVDGHDLRNRAPRGTCSDREVLTQMKGVANAVAYAHEQGVIHCDLTPGNILMDRDGQAKLTDFGLARSLIGQQWLPQPAAGTAAFMAPEQVNACWGELGPATDVWGLTAVLYFLISGTPPIAGERIPDILAELVSGRPVPSLNSVCPGVDQEIVRLCEEGLRKSQQHRIQTAKEFLHRLESVQASVE